GLDVPLWILGSSLFGAQLAAALGLPYAFAAHFAPGALRQALDVYRNTFKPSSRLGRPYAIAAVNVVAADEDLTARRLFSSLLQQFTQLLRGTPGQLQPPIDDIDRYWTPAEKMHVTATLEYSFVGTGDDVRDRLETFVQTTGIDELMVVSAIHDHAARLR